MAVTNAGNVTNDSSTKFLSYNAAGTFSVVGAAGPLLNVANGGIGATPTTAYSVVCGGTTSTADLQYISPGSSGWALTSQGAGALPVFKSFTGSTAYNISTISTSPADATTYYLHCGKALSTAGTTGQSIYYIPAAMTLVAVYGRMSFTAGSSQTSTISFRKNDTTDTTISSTLDFSSSPITISNTSLSVSMAAGDYFSIKWVTPTWTPTNPTAVLISLTLLFE